MLHFVAALTGNRERRGNVMSTTRQIHPTDNDIELYSMGRLSEEAASPLEEHLLLCEPCRNRVDDSDEFVATMRNALLANTAAASVEVKRPSFWSRLFAAPVPVWAGAMAVIALVAVLAPWRQGSVEPFAVQLETFRGAGTPAAAIAPAGRPLLLHVDAKGLPASVSYQMELADARGDSVWESEVQPRNETFTLDIDRSLSSGQYWMRIYRNASTGRGELLREFALRIDK